MLELLEYVTSGFWVFLGSMIIIPTFLLCTGWAINALLLGLWGKKCSDIDISL